MHAVSVVLAVINPIYDISNRDVLGSLCLLCDLRMFHIHAPDRWYPLPYHCGWVSFFTIPLLVLDLYLFLIFSFVELIYWLLVYVYAMRVSGGTFSIAHVWRQDDNFWGCSLYILYGFRAQDWVMGLTGKVLYPLNEFSHPKPFLCTSLSTCTSTRGSLP